MRIIERIRALNLPQDEFIVIGSGLLDAWSLRSADDIDLVVTNRLFQHLQESGKYTTGSRYEESFLAMDDQEIWLSWGKGNDFEFLKQDAVTVDGIMFVNPEFLIDHKRERGTAKDLNDIQLLEQYLHERH